MCAGGEFVAQIAQVVFDLAEGFVVGQVGEAVGHAPEDGLGINVESRENGLAANLTLIGYFRSGRSDVFQHENLSGLAPTAPVLNRVNFPRPPQSRKTPPFPTHFLDAHPPAAFDEKIV